MAVHHKRWQLDTRMNALAFAIDNKNRARRRVRPTVKTTNHHIRKAFSQLFFFYRSLFTLRDSAMALFTKCAIRHSKNKTRQKKVKPQSDTTKSMAIKLFSNLIKFINTDEHC